MHVDLTRNRRPRVAVLAVLATLALVPGTALAAPSKPKPRPKPSVCCKGSSPYMIHTMSEVLIG
ncbi:MAG TPA: hypothetical protein VGF23_13865 [Gaiellaceae bacterium]|jgi:hypothetical protein